MIILLVPLGMAITFTCLAYVSTRRARKYSQAVSTFSVTVLGVMAIGWLYFTLYLLWIPQSLRESIEAQQVMRGLVTPILGVIPLILILLFYLFDRFRSWLREP